MSISNQEFDRRARTIFRPVYPLIAEQILAHTGISQGVCLDLGCGGGYLGLALARRSELALRFLDQSEEMLAIARRNLAEEGLADRGETLLASAEDIPLPDGSVDLAVSRGSVFFWEDHARAFGEIYRVLASGGMTYIGGGFGSAALKQEIARQMDELDPDSGEWRGLVKRNMGPEMRAKFEDGLERAGIRDYTILQSPERGTWIVIRKQG